MPHGGLNEPDRVNPFAKLIRDGGGGGDNVPNMTDATLRCTIKTLEKKKTQNQLTTIQKYAKTE
jgi:hypothetical protein